MKIKIIFCAILILSFYVLNAQTYEIRAVNKTGGIVGVELMITSGTPPVQNDNVTDIVFGLKWDSAYNINLQDSLTGYKIKKSDTAKIKGGYRYQAFYADGIPFNFPATWSLNNWVEILSINNTRNSIIDTGRICICESGFDVTTDPNFGINLNDYTPAIAECAQSVLLPLSLIGFGVTPQQSSIQLSWTTSAEHNNKGFVIERSLSGTFSFDSIGWVSGRGNSLSEKNYLFKDEKVTPGILYYYRLKQTGTDGKFTFSTIKSARIESDEDKAFSISPNPAKSVLQVLFSGNSTNGKINLRVIDTKGVIISETTTSFIAGGKSDINVSKLAAGQYYLVIEQEGKVLYKEAFQKL